MQPPSMCVVEQAVAIREWCMGWGRGGSGVSAPLRWVLLAGMAAWDRPAGQLGSCLQHLLPDAALVLGRDEPHTKAGAAGTPGCVCVWQGEGGTGRGGRWRGG